MRCERELMSFDYQCFIWVSLGVLLNIFSSTYFHFSACIACKNFSSLPTVPFDIILTFSPHTFIAFIPQKSVLDQPNDSVAFNFHIPFNKMLIIRWLPSLSVDYTIFFLCVFYFFIFSLFFFRKGFSTFSPTHSFVADCFRCKLCSRIFSYYFVLLSCIA